MRVTKSKLMILLIATFSIGCESNKDKNGVPGFTELPCDKLDQTDLKKYPKIIDSLINTKLMNQYSEDSLIKYKILGNVYYTISLIDCRIDSSSYNASVEVTTTKKTEYWLFTFEEKSNSMKVVSFYKNSLKKGSIPKQY